MTSVVLGWVDISLFVLLGVSMLVGLLRGVVFELLSLAGWFAAYFAARGLSPWAEPFVPFGEAGSGLNHGVAFALVFLGALIAWSIAARILRALIRATPLSPVDRVLGGVFGLARGVAVGLAVAFAVGASPLAKSTPWQQSRGAEWLNAMLRQLKPVWGGGPAGAPASTQTLDARAALRLGSIGVACAAGRRFHSAAQRFSIPCGVTLASQVEPRA